jgi:hypothetical protein
MQWWRVLFALAGILIVVGGPMHPAGSMEQMLADPKWVPAHSLLLAGFVAFLGALITVYRMGLPQSVRRWTAFAIAATALQAIEMALHTAAVVDHEHLVTHHATPVLSTHLAMSLVVYPLFAIAVVGFLWTAAKARLVGSPWIAWIGALGALGHGAAAPLFVGLDLPWARSLFATLILLAFWAIAAAVWPARKLAAQVAGAHRGVAWLAFALPAGIELVEPWLT